MTTVAAGDRVLVSCISACGRAASAGKARYGQCLGGGGWILGHTIDGVQAEYARSRSPTYRLYKLPEALSDERSCPRRHPADRVRGRRAHRMFGPGTSVAIVGAGPIGLAAILTAQLFSPEPRSSPSTWRKLAWRAPASSAPTRDRPRHR